MDIGLKQRALPLAHRLWELPLTWFLLALSLNLVAAANMWDQQSLAPHYVHLADSLLHGRLDLMHTENLYDLLVVDGRAYVAGSPLPAILLAPLVAIFNNQFSDVLFSIVVAALNVGLVHHLFRKPWLTLLFALGTPHLYMGALGSVWLMAHLVAILFALLALYAGWKRHNWFLAGLALALAGLSRPNLLFGAAFFLLYIYLQHARRPLRPRLLPHMRPQLRKQVRPLLLFTLPVALGVAAHLLYNAARFGAPLDFGYQYTAGAPNLVATYRRFGGFDLHYFPCDLFVSLFNPPLIRGWAPPLLFSACDHLIAGVDVPANGALFAPNPLGMSLLLVTPAFLLLLGARRHRPVVIAAWAGLLATMIPLWTYHNTGSVQFGYRYWMDAAPFWLLLLAVTYPVTPAAPRLDRWLERARRPLILASIVVNVWGFLWIYNLFVGRQWAVVWAYWLHEMARRHLGW